MLRKFLLVVPIIALCTACSSTSKAPIEETTESSYSYSEMDKIATSLEEAIYAELDKETISFLATTTDSLRIYINAEDHVSFDIRVAICPDAIPFVAEHISPVALSIIQEQGYSDIQLKYNFYSENNIDGIEKNSFIMWMTRDGETGTLVTSEAPYSMTLDEVYSYFNDFMKEN